MLKVPILAKVPAVCIIVTACCGNPVGVAGGSPPTEGLVACYPLASNANDISGNSHHGVVVGSVDFNTSDRFGNVSNAMRIANGSSYIRISNHPGLEVQSHTISAWVKHLPGGQPGGVFNNGDIGLVDHYALRAGDEWVSHGIEYNSPNWDHDHSTSILSDGSWHHLLATYDGTHSRIWIDGRLVSTYYRGESISYNTHHDCYIGMNFPGGHDWFEGCIDDVMLYDRVLSQEEITQVYHAGEL